MQACCGDRRIMSNLIHLNDDNFDEVINGSDVPVIVDFSASWCGPCKVLTPVIEGLAAELNGTAKVCKVDIDEAPLSAQKHGIRSVPTIIAFKSGERVKSAVGLVPKAKLLELIQ